MFLGDRTLVSTIHLTSLVKLLKIVGILQKFEICNNNSIWIPTVIPKTGLGNKDWFFETYHGFHSLSSFCSLQFCWLTSPGLCWCTHSVLNFGPSAMTLLLSAKQGSL